MKKIFGILLLTFFLSINLLIIYSLYGFYSAMKLNYERENSSIIILNKILEKTSTREMVEIYFDEQKKYLKQRPDLMTQTTNIAAASALQNDVRALVLSNQGELRTFQSMPLSTSDGFEHVGVLFDIAIKLDRLPSFLKNIDSHMPAIFVEKVEIRGQEIAGNNQPLSIRLTLFGLRLMDNKQ